MGDPMGAAASVFLGFAIMAGAFIFVSVKVYQIKPEIVSKVFKYALIGAFALIFSIASIAIGMRIDSRHNQTYSRSLKFVADIWGGQIAQNPPAFFYDGSITEQYLDEKTNQYKTRVKTGQINAGFQAQKLDVNIKKNIRKKGLLSFPGYSVAFNGTYILNNATGVRQNHSFVFALPSNAGNISGISVKFDGAEYKGDSNYADGINWRGDMVPGETHTITVSYNAQGTESFVYSLADKSIEVKKLEATIHTDFTDVNYPENSMLPAENVSDNDQSRLTWKAENVVTGQNISLKFGIPGNYGAVISKMFLYAPLPILLFTGFLLIVCAARQIRLHPFHYLFIITSFFVYYLIGSYLVSYIPIITAILASLAVSGAILLYYVKLIGKGKEIISASGAGILVFQWFFSGAFFFPEHTGFLITIASVIAFIVLIKVTAKIDWENKW